MSHITKILKNFWLTLVDSYSCREAITTQLGLRYVSHRIHKRITTVKKIHILFNEQAVCGRDTKMKKKKTNLLDKCS